MLRDTVRHALILLFIIELLFVYLDITVTLYGASDSQPLQDLCNLVIEGSMGGWFSSATTLLVAVAAWLIHRVEAKRPESVSRFPGWLVVAAFFAFMALDDGSGLHEAFGTAFEDAYKSSPTGFAASLLRAFPSYPWQVLFAPFLAAGGTFTAWWSLRKLPERGLRILIVTGLACFVVAVGLDFLEGLESPYDTLGRALRLDDVTLPHLAGVLEESIELLGTGFFLTAYGAFYSEREADAEGSESRTP